MANFAGQNRDILVGSLHSVQASMSKEEYLKGLSKKNDRLIPVQLPLTPLECLVRILTLAPMKYICLRKSRGPLLTC